MAKVIKKYALLVPIVKKRVISEIPIGEDKVKQTIGIRVFHFFYCGQKNHTYTGDQKTMLLGGRNECKLYKKKRANEVIRACKENDPENAQYYKLVVLS